MSNNEPLKFNHKEIGKSGLEWIKLLGVRYWATKDEHQKFIIPKNTKDSDEYVQSGR